MPPTARRREANPDEKPAERPGEPASAQVMAPTRMKLRVRRRDAAAGAGQPEEDQDRNPENSGGRSSRRKNSSNATTTSSSSPPSSSSSSSTAAAAASASARALMAAEDASPDSKCPICLDRFNNLAYLDRCLHRFCFPCIQEWSHNKAECPLCKQPFASILHSVRAEDDFKEYTLRPPPATSSVAATVAMVAAMASAARSSHQMRLTLRRHRAADGGGEAAAGRRRRRARGGGRAGERAGMWEWYLDSPPLPHHPAAAAVSPVVAEDSDDGGDLEEPRAAPDLTERGVIFEGLTGLGGGVAPVPPNDRASRRLMTRLAARQRLQREGGTVRRLRERETVAFRRNLYRSGIRVQGVAGVDHQGQQQQRDITAESFRRNPAHLNRLRPWLQRELTVLYGAHGTLVDIVQRIITARLARHGLEDAPTVEDELRPFLLARTDHFLHELVHFARSPLGLDDYDLRAVYEPPAGALEPDEVGSSDGSSVIAISEGEDEAREAGPQEGEGPQTGRGAAGSHDDVIQAGSCLSLSAWDDETPGPSYSTAEPSCSLSSLTFSPAPQEAPNEERGEKEEGEEEECLIVGYKKPMAERTPELVQLSSDTEEEQEKKEEVPPLAASYLPTIPPSTSGAFRDEQLDPTAEKDGGRRSRARSWSGSSGRSSVCALSPAPPGETASWTDRKRGDGEVAEKTRRRKRSRRRRDRNTLCNPNRSIFPPLMRRRSPSPFHSSVASSSPPTPSDSSWEFGRSQLSPFASSVSSVSSVSSSSPRAPSETPPPPSLSPSDHSGAHHGEKPGGKRKYKSRHLDNDKDPTWRPSGGRRERRREERREKERRKRRREEGRRRERQRRDGDSRGSREERSPSVEIIYEGTIAANAAQPPARKRRRRRQSRPQPSSSPVIITLDSDSSHGDRTLSSSSSPLSSQQTVDFSDLPPLPLVHSSAAVGGNLPADIGELPVDILDRGSDGSDTEPLAQPWVVPGDGPIAVDNSETSDRDVDVENVDDNEAPPASGGANGPIPAAADGTDRAGPRTPPQDPGANKASQVPDSHLLAAILEDLKGFTAPESGELPSASRPDPDSSPGRGQSRDFLSCGAATPELSEAKDPPPLLKQASPFGLYHRNTPPPLRHKDAGSPLLLPSGSDALSGTTHLEPNRTFDPTDSQTTSPILPISPIPPISTLKRRFPVAPTNPSFNPSHSSTLHSDVQSAEASTPEPDHLHPLTSPVQSDSRNKTLSSDSCRGVGFHYGSVLPGPDRDAMSVPPVFFPAVGSLSDSRCEDQSEKLTPSRVDSAATSRVSPVDEHRRPKSTSDLCSSAAPDGPSTLDRFPHGHLALANEHQASPAVHERTDEHRASPVVDGHRNHTALPSATFPTPHKERDSPSGPAAESRSIKRLHDACSNHKPPIDFKQSNHVASSPRPVQDQWDSSVEVQSEPQSPVDGLSAGGVWNAT